MALVRMAHMYQFRIEHGSFKKTANANATYVYTVSDDNNRLGVSLMFKRLLSGVDSITGTIKNTRSSQPTYSIYHCCKSETCPMDVDDDLCYHISPTTWYEDDAIADTDDNTASNPTTTVQLELCQPALLSARGMSSASLDVITITTTALSSSSEMVVTTHLPYSITHLKVNPLEYTLLFNGSSVAHARSAAINTPSFVDVHRNSFYVLDIDENPPNDLTFLVSVSMVIDELAKTLNMEEKSS